MIRSSLLLISYFISRSRFIQLTNEIKAKIDSLQKVAKKLERFSEKPNDQSKDNLFETSFSDSGEFHHFLL